MDTLKKLMEISTTLVPTNKSKEKAKKYEELWIKIRDVISSIPYVDKFSHGFNFADASFEIFRVDLIL